MFPNALQMTVDADFSRLTTKRKYLDLCQETLADVYCSCLVDSRGRPEALNRAKKRLHRIWAGYLGEPDYSLAERELQTAFASACEAEIRRVCRHIMSAHSSARERLELLDSGYYERIWEITSTPRIILDLASALHPFSFRWMGLGRDVRYYAYDINRRFIHLINSYFQLEGLEPFGEWRDIYVRPPEVAADVAFLFKMFHCLESRKRGAGLSVIEHTPARWIVVTFPLRTLAGLTINFYERYAQAIVKLAARNRWELRQTTFEDETIVFIHKGNGESHLVELDESSGH